MSRSTLGKRARAKGKLFQKSIVQLVSKILNIPEEDLHSCVGGKTEPDVKMSTFAQRIFPFHIECKNQKTLHLKSWIKQSEEESADKTSLVVFKFHGNSTPYVAMRFEEFLEVWKEKTKMLTQDQKDGQR